MIDDFNCEYYFLTNFFEAQIEYEGLTYTNNEAAFQATKTLDKEIRKEFQTYNPAWAKYKGRQLDLRADWEDIKDNVMYEICKIKFTKHPNLKKQLLATGDQLLVEGNDWDDTYWGVCGGIGQNKLGKILMRIRKELQ